MNKDNVKFCLSLPWLVKVKRYEYPAIRNNIAKVKKLCSTTLVLVLCESSPTSLRNWLITIQLVICLWSRVAAGNIFSLRHFRFSQSDLVAVTSSRCETQISIQNAPLVYYDLKETGRKHWRPSQPRCITIVWKISYFKKVNIIFCN